MLRDNRKGIAMGFSFLFHTAVGKKLEESVSGLIRKTPRKVAFMLAEAVDDRACPRNCS